MPQPWAIPEKFRDKCSSCNAPLRERDYERCGVALHGEPYGIFFDYRCPTCDYRGRYVYVSKSDPRELLRRLATHLDSNEEKGMALEALNKIHDVNDLLRLSDTDVRRETDDENEAGFGRPSSP